MMGHDDAFPPKNRTTRTDLGALDIEIADHDGNVLKFDPNSLLVALMDGSLADRLGRPFPKETGGSVLSGEAGYRYSDCDVELVLTREELNRFLTYDLRPNEYLALRNRYGMFYMIHDDFYDEESGTSLQPKFGGGSISHLGR